MDQYVLLYVAVGFVWAAMLVQAHRNRHAPEEWQQRWAPLVGPEAAKALYQESVVKRMGLYSGALMFVTIVVGITSHVRGASHVAFGVMLCATFLAMSVATFLAPKKRKQACAHASDVLRVTVHPSMFPPSDPQQFAAWCNRHHALNPQTLGLPSPDPNIPMVTTQHVQKPNFWPARAAIGTGLTSVVGVAGAATRSWAVPVIAAIALLTIWASVEIWAWRRLRSRRAPSWSS